MKRKPLFIHKKAVMLLSGAAVLLLAVVAAILLYGAYHPSYPMIYKKGNLYEDAKLIPTEDVPELSEGLDWHFAGRVRSACWYRKPKEEYQTNLPALVGLDIYQADEMLRVDLGNGWTYLFKNLNPLYPS